MTLPPLAPLTEARVVFNDLGRTYSAT